MDTPRSKLSCRFVPAPARRSFRSVHIRARGVIVRLETIRPHFQFKLAPDRERARTPRSVTFPAPRQSANRISDRKDALNPARHEAQSDLPD